MNNKRDGQMLTEREIEIIKEVADLLNMITKDLEQIARNLLKIQHSLMKFKSFRSSGYDDLELGTQFFYRH